MLNQALEANRTLGQIEAEQLGDQGPNGQDLFDITQYSKRKEDRANGGWC